MGLFFPAPLLPGGKGAWTPRASISCWSRKKGREESFGKEGELVEVTVMLHFPSALHKPAHLSFLQRFCSRVTAGQAHPDLGFLASREDPKLLQAIPISGFFLK